VNVTLCKCCEAEFSTAMHVKSSASRVLVSKQQHLGEACCMLLWDNRRGNRWLANCAYQPAYTASEIGRWEQILYEVC